MGWVTRHHSCRAIWMVAAAGMADLARDRDAAKAQRDRLEGREDALRLVAERCAAEIAAPPRLAVPDLEALGPVPQDRAGLDAYRALQELVTAARERAPEEPLTSIERERLPGTIPTWINAVSDVVDITPRLRTVAEALRPHLDVGPQLDRAARELEAIVNDETATAATPRAAPKPILPMNGIPTNSRPKSATIAIPPAVTTARPEVASDFAQVFGGGS